MNEQIPIPLSGTALRDIGIAQAVDHAEAEAPGWASRAIDMLKRYLQQADGAFMTEQVRAYSKEQGLSEPVNLRAWGGIIVKARNAGLIRCVGTQQVKNPTAHCANAAKWIRVSE